MVVAGAAGAAEPPVTGNATRGLKAGYVVLGAEVTASGPVRYMT